MPPPTRVLFPIQVLTGPVTTPDINVPNNLDAVWLAVIANEPDGFSDPAEVIELAVDASLDGGTTWLRQVSFTAVGGARDRNGNRPNTYLPLPARVGPQRKARATLRPIAGTPTVGISGDAV